MEEKVEEVTTVSQPESVVKTTRKVEPTIRTEHPQHVYEKKKVIFRSHQVIWYILVFIEVLIGFRVALLALGANPLSGFTSLIYGITSPLVAPFQGIIRTNVTANGGQAFEWASLIAAIVYLFVAMGIAYLLQFLKPVSPREVSEAVDTV
ncbi:MAG: YggT family protein [Candidatus Levybacteria bacterium]|nr:YggT family protein [Candidatus Levybacteria bacterium]